ncbi:MAG: response regulator transcription factor [Flavobacteriales bacterium]|nr:response regulator transcription factor [Flavobacteriales bacterium]
MRPYLAAASQAGIEDLLNKNRLIVISPINLNAFMEEYRILVVEDEESIASMIKLNLEMEGYKVILAATGPIALDKFRNQAFDLCILDVMLPEVDGISICETIRLEGIKTPVLFLSAKGSSKERIEGLKAGGDDYLAKPFDFEELHIRVQKLITRKNTGYTPLDELTDYEFGGNKVNFLTFSIVDKEGKTHQLSRKEIMLLRLLIQKKGEVVSREEILEKIWGYDVFPSTRTIDNFILLFRKHFEPNSRQPFYFHSVRGVGYKFTPLEKSF